MPEQKEHNFEWNFVSCYPHKLTTYDLYRVVLLPIHKEYYEGVQNYTLITSIVSEKYLRNIELNPNVWTLNSGDDLSSELKSKICSIFLPNPNDFNGDKRVRFAHYLCYNNVYISRPTKLPQIHKLLKTFEDNITTLSINGELRDKDFPISTFIHKTVSSEFYSHESFDILAEFVGKCNSTIDNIDYQFLDMSAFTLRKHQKINDKKEEKTMKEKTVTKTVANAVEDGAKRAAVYEASEILLDLSKEVLSATLPLLPESMYEDPQNREILKFIMAVAVVTLNDVSPNLVPHGDKMETMAKMVMSNSTQKVLEPHLAKLKKAASELALIHQTLGE